MMAVKKRRISAERRTAMVDILLKANADLNTQENVRYQYQNMYIQYCTCNSVPVHNIIIHNYCVI